MSLQSTMNEILANLKKIYNDASQSLDETTTATELVIFNTIRSFNLELSVDEISNRSLKQL